LPTLRHPVPLVSRNGRRQFPEPQQPYRRIDTVLGSSHDNLANEDIKTLEVIGETVEMETKTETPLKEEPGFIDSYFGDGAQVRLNLELSFLQFFSAILYNQGYNFSVPKNRQNRI
jgi:hypothetical protein